jgi:hypothetical protein
VMPSTTIFMAGQLVMLERPCAYGGRLPLAAVGGGKSFLIHCGTSSYAVGTTIHAPSAATAGDSVRVGFSVQSFVAVGTATRKPTPFATEVKEQAAKWAAESSSAVKAAKLWLPERLAGMPSATAEPTYRFMNRVRPFSDVDFNGHMNQGVYINLALDALYEWSALQQRGQALVPLPFGTSMNVRAVRIDYLAEIVDVTASVDVDLTVDPNGERFDFVRYLRGLDNAASGAPPVDLAAVCFVVKTGNPPRAHAHGVLVLAAPPAA